MKIREIKINYLREPMGIAGDIQVGWLMEAVRHPFRQKAYELQIADTADFQNLLYDSGLRQEEDSAHVMVRGICWKSLTRYYLRVRVLGEDGADSGWSDGTSFVTAVQRQEEFQGEFITAETQEDIETSKGTYVRKEFVLKKGIREAYVVATALGLYDLYLNGSRVGQDELKPGWTSYGKHLLYQTYEVTKLLQSGGNAIGAMLGAGWYKGTMGFLHEHNIYGERTALYACLVVRYEDGTQETVVTDQDWKGQDAPVLFAEIYDGEIYDARMEIPHWAEPGLGESGWKPVETVAYDKTNMQPQSGCTVREMTRVPAQRVFVTPAGDTVVDFGQNLAGWVHVQTQGTCGQKMVLRHFETLDTAGNVYLDNLREAKAQFTYMFRDNEPVTVHPHFTYMGFRYVWLEAYEGPCRPEDFTAYALYSNMEETGSFQCSNPLINQLQHNILWSMKGNFLDVPTDCPQRDERLGWTGDAQIFCRTASYLMDTYTFYKKWLTDVAADQTPEGGVPHVVPDILTHAKQNDDWLVSQGTHSAAAWADVAVINPWTLYLNYGDTEILEQQYDSMKAWIDFMQKHAVDGIWNYKLQFGDWVALDAQEGSYYGATPNDLTCTAYYAYSTGLFAKIAAILGCEEDARIYGALEQEIRGNFVAHFFDDKGKLAAQTQTAHILVLYFDLVPEAYRARTVDGLLKLLEKEQGHLVTGFVGTPYFCHALSRNGHSREAYELLLQEDFPSWLYQVKQGATTVWEHWDGLKPDGTMWSPDMNSFNHYAYGAIGEWLYRVAAGIEIDEKHPGYQHSILAPEIEAFDFVKASYKSVYGTIGVHWEKQEKEITLQCTIPPNTTAEIRLEHVKEMHTDAGISFVGEAGAVTGVSGSGTYEIRYTCE